MTPKPFAAKLFVTVSSPPGALNVAPGPVKVTKLPVIATVLASTARTPPFAVICASSAEVPVKKLVKSPVKVRALSVSTRTSASMAISALPAPKLARGPPGTAV